MHPGPLGKGDLGRQRVDLGFQAQGFFGVGAAHRTRGVNPVARGHRFDPRPHRFHHPGGIHARGVRQRRGRGIGSGPDVGIHRIDPGRLDFDQDLAGA